jgi:hypothetical protein
MKKIDDASLQTAEGREANVIDMETRLQMCEKLRKPVKFERSTGWYMDGAGPFGLNATAHIFQKMRSSSYRKRLPRSNHSYSDDCCCPKQHFFQWRSNPIASKIFKGEKRPLGSTSGICA